MLVIDITLSFPYKKSRIIENRILIIFLIYFYCKHRISTNLSTVCSAYKLHFVRKFIPKLRNEARWMSFSFTFTEYSVNPSCLSGVCRHRSLQINIHSNLRMFAWLWKPSTWRTSFIFSCRIGNSTTGFSPSVRQWVISIQNMTSTGTTGNYNVNTLVLFFFI